MLPPPLEFQINEDIDREVRQMEATTQHLLPVKMLLEAVITSKGLQVSQNNGLTSLLQTVLDGKGREGTEKSTYFLPELTPRTEEEWVVCTHPVSSFSLTTQCKSCQYVSCTV